MSLIYVNFEVNIFRKEAIFVTSEKILNIKNWLRSLGGKIVSDKMCGGLKIFRMNQGDFFGNN